MSAMKVQQLMHRPVQWCSPADHCNVPARLMWEHDCGAVPVCLVDSDGRQRVIAMITDRDIAMAAYTQGKPLADIPVRTAMSRAVATCRATDNLAAALKILQTHQLHRLPVVDADDTVVGMLSLTDVVQALDATADRAAEVASVLRSVTAPRAQRAVTAPAPAPGPAPAAPRRGRGGRGKSAAHQR